MNSPLHFRREHRICFSECDPAGIVFYPMYFVMFNDLLEAWIDSLLPFGFAGYILDKRWGMPTVRLEADFKAVSRMGDEVVSTLDVVKLGNRSISLALRCEGKAGDLRMAVNQTLVTTSLVTHEAIPIPEELRVALTPASETH
jgi:4-hydroxybenzoyl-CoA thioesterase